MESSERFAALLARDEAEIDLDRAALLLAAVEYPDLDVDAQLATLDRLAEALGARLAGVTDVRAVVETVADYLHRELGFAGNTDDYYDPRNSYLNDVLERRLGIPITLSTLYLALGRRLGLPFEGIGMPGHFLVGYRRPAGPPLMVDAFAGGMLVGEADLEVRLRGIYGPAARLEPAMLRPVGVRAILFRMLANLKGIYVTRQDWTRAVRTIDLLLVVQPGAVSEYRDRGMAHLRAGDLRRARADLEHYLLNAVGEEDASLAREQLALVERLDAMRN